MEESSSKKWVEDCYNVRWNRPLGEGSFGTVYVATDRKTGEQVALKKIPKKFTDDVGFQREMDALLHVRAAGGHPNICALRENFNEGRHYYLALDLISGGEMFDHLVKMGAYSEHDASRLIREIASALAFLHGIGVVHGDMKPENVMLSTNNPSDCVVKIVDFGCSQVEEMACAPVGITPAYSPPEVLDKNNANSTMRPSQDMWALGIILYIMLTGLHPFDLNGNATDEEIEEHVLSGKPPPLRGSPITAHLSESSIELIEKLMAYDPEKRLTALEMLDHPWVRGETARTQKIEGSDKRLSLYRVFQTRLEAQVFRDIVTWSDNGDGGVKQRTSLIERSFRNLDPSNKGYLSQKDLRRLSKSPLKDIHGDDEKLSLAGFSDLLSENMKNKYFSKGHIVYKEGDTGNHMYFINSGTIEVTTKDGTKARRTTGDFFGEGALLHPRKIRSATIQCVTPVHAIEISREYFEKYMAESDDLKVSLKEKDRSRKRGRAKMILRLQNHLVEKIYNKGELLFKEGEEGNELYIVEEGFVDVSVQGRKVFAANVGDVTGEHSLVLGRPRNTTAVCSSNECKVLAMRARDFYSFLDSTPHVKESIKDICLRRELMKALVFRTRKPFPTDPKGLRWAFNQVDKGRKGKITPDDVRSMLKDMDPTLTEEDLMAIFHALDVSDTGAVSFEAFEKMFRSESD
jgi:serine/threonine protein kinase